MQLDPLAHMVPGVHVAHAVPSLPMTFGMVVPHATDAGLGQVPQHSRSIGLVSPIGAAQLVPAGHIEPTPVQVRHVGDGIASPHATEPAAAHVGQQVPPAPPVHVVPEPQPIVPKPVHVRQMWPIPSSTFGIGMPQAIVLAAAQLPQHS